MVGFAVGKGVVVVGLGVGVNVGADVGSVVDEIVVLDESGLHIRPSGRESPGQFCLLAGVQKNHTVKSSIADSANPTPVIISKLSYHSGFECLPELKAQRIGPPQTSAREVVVVEVGALVGDVDIVGLSVGIVVGETVLDEVSGLH